MIGALTAPDYHLSPRLRLKQGEMIALAGAAKRDRSNFERMLT